MWKFNPDSNKWDRQKDVIDKKIYNNLRQDLEDLRFYSKCIDGTSYLPINNLEDIYDIFNYTTLDTWSIDSNSSIYSSVTPSNKSIDSDTILSSTANGGEYYKYMSEYGFTLKNLMTPDKIIKDSVNNFLTVDVGTVNELMDLLDINTSMIIDGVRLKKGHRVLVKDQKTIDILANSIDPDVFFDGNYTIVEAGDSTTEYFYYNDQNGIYYYNGEKLVRSSDLDIYDNNVRYSVHVKLGIENRDKQYHLSRLKNGFYPTSSNSDPIEFIEKKNWILRNKVDYQNWLELSLQDSIKHDIQYTGSYSVPERTVIVGEFGSILNYQDNILHIIKNKFKDNINSISESDTNYWAVGDNGTLLKISKIDFSIEKIPLNTLNNLNSISFFNNLRGFAVGDFNEMYYTLNSGKKWEKLELSVESWKSFKYNSVIFYNLFDVYIAGDNGVFIKLTIDNNEWIYKKIVPVKIESEYDEFDVVDNIFDISPISFTSSWTLGYSFTTSSTIKYNKEALLLSGDNNLLFMLDINNFSDKDYIFLDSDSNFVSVGDIRSSVQSGTAVHIAGDSKYIIDINSFTALGLTSNVINGSFINDIGVKYNNIFNFNDQELIMTGDFLTIDSLSGTSSTSIVSSTFSNDRKSKMMFLDYDIGSKLNWFDTSENYRLPSFTSSYGDNIFNISNPIGFTFSLTSLDDELSWLDYWKDDNKVFIYNESMIDSNKVLINTSFRYMLGSTNSIIVGATSITNTPSDMVELMPTFFGGGGTISTPSTLKNLYLYDNLMVLAVDISYNLDSEVGDVFKMESDIVTDNFTLNRIETLGTYNYHYFYSYFNDNITNSIVGSTYSVNFTNLNKLPTNNLIPEYFNSHPISDGYNMTDVSQGALSNYKIDPIFNNFTAYYNMQTKIILQNSSIIDIYNMNYKDGFLKFGYSPIYNILDYLVDINPSTFTASMTYDSMPVYTNIPSGGKSSNEILKISDNKLLFSKDLKFEYDSIWKNTFLDINTDESVYGTFSTQKALVIDKSYDADIDRYVVYLHKSINTNTSTNGWVGNIDILSRNTLSQISSDLREINNIHRSINVRNTNISNFSILQNELNFKFNTDNYAKILLSDNRIRENISAIVFTDYKNELSLNIVNRDKIDYIKISNTQDSGGYLRISATNHGLSISDGIVINLGIDSTDIRFDSFTTVTQIIDNNNFIVNIPYDITMPVVGNIIYYNFDESLNYEASDIIDVGIDAKSKISVDISIDNIRENMDNTISLINLDINKFKFKLIDTLNIDVLLKKYPWILEAEITNALIGEDSNGLVWYDGIWKCGRWFGGTWYSGKWYDGQWYDGDFYGIFVDKTSLSGIPKFKVDDNDLSTWYNGDFRGGNWHNGTWHNGTWYNGTWESGDWFGGRWNSGVWNNGDFKAGTWISGTWQNGKFNCDNGLSKWIDGDFVGGDFECGIWFNGNFTEKNGNKSRFGTKSSNSRKSIWKGGKFFSGTFHSNINIDDLGNYLPSTTENNKLSIWETGIWFNGIWYGGTMLQSSFKGGTWKNGVLKGLDIVGIHPKYLVSGNLVSGGSKLGNRNDESFFVVEGEYYFNRNDEIFIIDNQFGNTYSSGTYSIGNDYNIGEYLVKDVKHFDNNGVTFTEVFIYDDIDKLSLFFNTVGESTFPDLNIGTTSITRGGYSGTGTTNEYKFVSENTKLSIVTKMQQSTWEGGIWINGIFENHNWESGIWINGVFAGGEFV